MTPSDYEETIFMALSLKPGGSVPVYQQLVTSLRALILSGQLPASTKLPASRSMAARLGVSRVTIVNAMDQLVAEGYVNSRRGAGLYIAPDISQTSLPVREHMETPGKDHNKSKPYLSFQPGVPDMRRFPHKDWARLFQRIWSNPQPALLATPDKAGWWPLRVEIAGHLRVWRGVECKPEQIIITSGAAEAMQLITDTLFTKGDGVAREDPGYRLFDHILARNGMDVAPLKVDESGLSVAALAGHKKRLKCVITTPSRHYPLGTTMPLGRRLSLLKWAKEAGAIIIEDDYDSEYRYVGQPVPALMSLTQRTGVIYLGSFSKVFSNSLRLGYMVVPQDLVEKFNAQLAIAGPSAALISQPVLARFMEQGLFASHLRRMRRIYGERQKTFLKFADTHLLKWLQFTPNDAGMHLIGQLTPRMINQYSDVEICSHARKIAVDLRPLTAYCSGAKMPPAVIAGYAGFDETEIERGIMTLAAMFENLPVRDNIKGPAPRLSGTNPT